MIDTSKVRELTHEEVLLIYENTSFSNHARDRMVEREAVLQDIISSPLAYINTDGTINIQNRVKPKEYFVFAKTDRGFIVITYKEQSKNGISLRKKYQLALKGYERKEEKTNETNLS